MNFSNYTLNFLSKITYQNSLSNHFLKKVAAHNRARAKYLVIINPNR